MINGLICKVFHKKEVCVEDVTEKIEVAVADAVCIAVQFTGPVLVVHWMYRKFCCEYDPNNSLYDFFTGILGAFGVLLTIVFVGVMLDEYYTNHKKDIIAVCPNARNEEEKKE